MKRVFVASIIAQRGNKFVSNTWASYDPSSEAEALGMALTFAKERWSASDGYHNHTVSVSELPQSFLEDIIKENNPCPG